MTAFRKIDTYNADVYKTLFDTFYPTLIGFILGYLDDRQVAEDIAQDVFFDLWVRKLSFDSEMSLKTYCYRSARSRSLDYLKHTKVHLKNIPNITIYWQENDLLNRILEEEVFTLLKKAINELPDDTRMIYELTLLGHDNQKIAEIMQTSIDSVKSKKKRGKAILQEKLKNSFILILPFIS